LAAFAVSLFLCNAAVAQSRPQGLPSVSIVEMQDLAQTGQAEAFRTMVQSAISSTQKFRIFEDNTRVLRTRQNRANAGEFTTRTPGRRGGFEGADFLVYGAITSGSATRSTDVGSVAGRLVLNSVLGRGQDRVQCDRVAANLAVDIRVVDGTTGEVRYSGRINRTTQSQASCSGNAALDMAAVLRGTADAVASKLVTTIFPVQIAAVQGDGSIILNYGEGTLAVGQILNVYGPGERIPDPANGTMMTVDGPQLGRIRVTEVNPRFSRAVAAAPFASPPAIGLIAREPPPGSVAAESERGRRGRRSQ
jgi:curli biogenesis system outer membrane secretion channel CsgG